MEWCDLDEQMVQLGLVASTSYSCSSSLSSTGGGSGGSLVAASAFEAQCVDRGRQLLAMGATALVDGEDLIQVLALFDEALEKAPTLKPFAVRACVCVSVCVLCWRGSGEEKRWASLKKQHISSQHRHSQRHAHTHTHTHSGKEALHSITWADSKRRRSSLLPRRWWTKTMSSLSFGGSW